jgi:hypothetical protein
MSYSFMGVGLPLEFYIVERKIAVIDSAMPV